MYEIVNTVQYYCNSRAMYIVWYSLAAGSWMVFRTRKHHSCCFRDGGGMKIWGAGFALRHEFTHRESQIRSKCLWTGHLQLLTSSFNRNDAARRLGKLFSVLERHPASTLLRWCVSEQSRYYIWQSGRLKTIGFISLSSLDLEARAIGAHISNYRRLSTIYNRGLARRRRTHARAREGGKINK